MVCERQPDSPNDPAEGRIELDARRRVADGERHDARRGRRRRDRRDDGAGRGSVAAARPARAADDRGRGGRAGGGERARRLAAARLDPAQPRQRGGRHADGRLRGQHRHVDPGDGGRADRSTTAPSTLSVTVERRPGRPLGHEHRARAARTPSRCSAARCARRSARCRSGSSRSTAARAATPSPAMPRRSCPCAASRGEAFRHAVAAAPRPRSATTTPRPTPAVTVTVDQRRRCGRRLDGRGHRRAARRGGARARPARSRMSPDFDGLVETSTSLGEAITEGDQLTLHSLSRSSNDSAMPGGDRHARGGGPAGRRRARGEAQLRRLAAEPRLAGAGGGVTGVTSRELRRAEPIVTGVHAGLEPAVIGRRRCRGSTCSRSGLRSSSRTRRTSGSACRRSNGSGSSWSAWWTTCHGRRASHERHPWGGVHAAASVR